MTGPAATARRVETPEFPELGFYALGGNAEPRDLPTEVCRGEELGLGAVFLSERFNYKDAAVMAGAAAAVSSKIGIANAATNHNTRHPIVTATMSTTLHRMTGGRYALGLGRGFGPLFDLLGLPRITNAQLTDIVEVYRRLWRGEKFAHDGPAGSWPYLFPMSELDDEIPILMVAIGPRSQQLAGRIADAVVLHTYLTDEAVAAAVQRIRGAAEEAGRDPASVRIWACSAVVDDAIEEQTRLRKTVGRLAAYLQGYGDTLVDANGWDPADLERFRTSDLVTGFSGSFDATASTEELLALREQLIPEHWLEAAITGPADVCAAGVRDLFDATGVDSVILHGATPDELADVLAHYRKIRPVPARELPANPGWVR